MATITGETGIRTTAATAIANPACVTRAETACVTIPRQSRGHSIVSRSKRQFGVANAAPHSWSHRFGGDSSPQAELIQPLVLLLLLLDLLPYHRLITTDC